MGTKVRCARFVMLIQFRFDLVYEETREYAQGAVIVNLSIAGTLMAPTSDETGAKAA